MTQSIRLEPNVTFRTFRASFWFVFFHSACLDQGEDHPAQVWACQSKFFGDTVAEDALSHLLCGAVQANSGLDTSPSDLNGESNYTFLSDIPH
jgi:hypothetical protein